MNPCATLTKRGCGPRPDQHRDDHDTERIEVQERNPDRVDDVRTDQADRGTDRDQHPRLRGEFALDAF